MPESYLKFLSPIIRSKLNPKDYFIVSDPAQNVSKIENRNYDIFKLTEGIDYHIVEARDISKAKKFVIFTEQGIIQIYSRLSHIFHLLNFGNNLNISANRIEIYIQKCYLKNNSLVPISIKTAIMAALKSNQNLIRTNKFPIKLEYLDLVSKFNLEFFQAFQESGFCPKP